MKENLLFSTDKSKLNYEMIIDFLNHESYWAKNRPRHVIINSINNSLCVGVYSNQVQIGFARVVSDFSTVFYLADFFLLPAYQRQGIGKLLMNYILKIKTLKHCRGILTTQTASTFYSQFGFSANNDIVQNRIMVRTENSAML